jgi:transcriptional regulator with XRE-family HTH domain
MLRAGYNQYGFGQHTRTLGAVQAVYAKLGKSVRRLRRELGWTQDVLADRSGLHRAHIGEIERGETNVTLLTLKTLADALNVRITDLLRGL